MDFLNLFLFQGARTVLAAIALVPLVLCQQPIQASWSSSSIGPDGPWQAVELTIASEQTVALYPGNLYASWLLTTRYCNFNRSSDGCYASVAGVYNKESGEKLGTGQGGVIQFSPPIQDFAPGIPVQGPETDLWTDSMDLSSGGDITVPSVSIALVEEQMLAYPNGQWYPAFAGCLGLGASRTVNQTFEYQGNRPNINASLIPGTLWDRGDIPSNSFGLHIGSVASEISGSLWWGGYDQHRVTGDIMSTHIPKDTIKPFETSLRDIAIEVLEGASPFNFSGDTQAGLLRAGGESSLPVLISGCSPYLSLPKSTCDSIASHLPVTYDAELGLYLWNTDVPQYEWIISSASALAFKLASESEPESESKSGDHSDITIRVPFKHLSLTLDKPLVSEPAPYFPCFTGTTVDNSVLGRAFMQDAFIGANWGREVWWLAQAPGPNLMRSAESTMIEENDREIQGGEQDWKDTWDGYWKVLTQNDFEGGPSEGDTSDSDGDLPGDPSSKSDGGLSTGAMAGIGVGVGCLVLACIASLVFFWFRRKKQARRQLAEQQHQHHEQQPQLASEAEWKGNVVHPDRAQETKSTAGPQCVEMYAENGGRQNYPDTTRYELM